MEKKILLVDDDEDFVTITKSQIEKKGYDVEVAYNGEECLKKVQQNKPDLILLDVLMPGLNGWDICEELKSNITTERIPIILLTAVQPPKSLYVAHPAFYSEFDDYINKPVDTKTLHIAIKKLLKL